MGPRKKTLFPFNFSLTRTNKQMRIQYFPIQILRFRLKKQKPHSCLWRSFCFRILYSPELLVCIYRACYLSDAPDQFPH